MSVVSEIIYAIYTTMDYSLCVVSQIDKMYKAEPEDNNNLQL